MGVGGSVFVERTGGLDNTQRMESPKPMIGPYEDDLMTETGECVEWDDPSETEYESLSVRSDKINNHKVNSPSTINRSIQDLKAKSAYVLGTPVISQTFIRYMFHGMWIIDLLQIPKELYISPTFSRAPSSFFSNSHLAEEADNGSMISLIHDLEKADLFDEVNKQTWSLFLQNARQYIESMSKDPIGVSFATSSILFMEQTLPEDKNVTILTVAIAMQIFCRSELFLQLSEQHWSHESIRLVQWQDYARIGRAQVARHYTVQNNSQEQICGISTVALLDALYVRLLMNSSQINIHKFLHRCDWIHELEMCLNSLSLDVSIYETSSSNPRSSEPVWSCVSRNNLQQKECNHGLPSKSSFSSDNLHQIMYRLCTSPSPSFFVSSPNSIFNNATVDNRYKLQFSAITPVFRCPLLTFAEKEHCFEQQKSYKWDAHQIVVTNIMIPASSSPNVLRRFTLDNGILANNNVHEMTLRNVQAAIDISFIIAQIVG